MYVLPENVTSPKGVIQNIYVVFDGGENSYSIALVEWNNKDSLAIRWNGSDGNKGHPVVRGVPVWFILPNELIKSVLSDILKNIDTEKEKVKFNFISIYLSSLSSEEKHFNYHKDVSFSEDNLRELQKLLARMGIFIDMAKSNSFGNQISINLIKDK